MKVPGVATTSDQPKYQHIPRIQAPGVVSCYDWRARAVQRSIPRINCQRSWTLLRAWCWLLQYCLEVFGGWSNPESTIIYSGRFFQRLSIAHSLENCRKNLHLSAYCCAMFAVGLLGLPFLCVALGRIVNSSQDVGRNAGSSLWPLSTCSFLTSNC